MGWLFKSSDERVLDRILDACDDGPCQYRVDSMGEPMVGRRPSGVMRQVVRELRSGGMSVADIISILTVIIDLIQVIGPIVSEIVKRIRDRRTTTSGD